MSRASILRGVVVPFILSVIPGWGHIWVRRTARGLLLFVVFFGALNLVFLATVIEPDMLAPVWVRIFTALFLSAGVFSFADILRITIWSRSRAVQDRRQTLLKRAVAHWMRDENGQAAEVLEKLLRIDPDDVAALVWSATLHEDGGRRRQAIRMLERARRADRDRVWAATINVELSLSRSRS